MTYSLPFGLKQKPVNKYFDGGLVRFSCREGKLYYLVSYISKKGNGTVQRGIIKDKLQLKRLLSLKSISEIPSIEVVN